ncbi:T9SS type A sorting domain-containing protein [Psychroserpens sp.]|uniref:T9SS type A sorting domain-containing protein n=1 Tax=Psychroserpens sp. TaxID=2020870 RepID=UPI003C70F2D0
MKKIYLLFTLLTISVGFSQNAPIDFETGGFGADWTWSTFEAPPEANDPVFSVIPNPYVDATNNSQTVAKIEIGYSTNEGWGSAGCETMHGADIGSFAVTPNNSLVSMLIYQEGFAAPVALKFATLSNAAYGQVIVNNTIADAWVEVEFDMSIWIGGLANENPDQLIFYPSHAARTTGHTVYFDNITFSEPTPVATPITAAPTPTQDPANVLSVFTQITGAPTPTSHYTDVANSNFNPNWGSNSGNVVIEPYGGDLGLRHPSLDYQGILIGGAGNSIDVSSMLFLHFDYWTDGGSSLRVSVVSVSGEEYAYDIDALGAIPQQQWVGIDVPLSYLTDQNPNFDFIVKELKFDQGGFETYHFDNLFFTTEATLNIEEVTKTNFDVYPNPSQDLWVVKTASAEMSSIIILDVLGKRVLSLSPNTNSIEIDASRLKAGLYLAKIKTNAGIETVKLIKN